MATFDGKYLTFYLMAVAKFALFLTIYQIIANQGKCQKFTTKIKVKVKEKKNGTYAIRKEMFESLTGELF